MKQTKRQKILLYTLPLSILGIGAISAPAILLFKKEDRNNEVFYLGDKIFNSRYEWEKEIRKLVREAETYEEKTTYYSNTQNKSFSDVNNLKKFLANNITTLNGSFYESNYDKFLKETNVDGSLSMQQLNQIDFNGVDTNDYVYLGKNGIAYKSEDEAKNSYSNAYSFYKFKDQYYSSKQEIKDMINKEILRINTNFTDDDERINALTNYFDIKQPNQVFKAPNETLLAYSESNKKIDDKKLDEFIETNCKKYIVDNGEIIEANTYTKNTEIGIKSGLPILYATSTQGKKKYVVDILNQDPCNLYGNYVHKSSGREIENITDRKKWVKKATNEFKQSRNDSQLRSLVSKFVSNLLATSNANFINDYCKKNNKSAEERKKLIEENVEQFSIFKYYKFNDDFNKMKKQLEKVKINNNDGNDNNLFKKLESIINFVKNGRNGEFFNQLSITYISGIAHLMKYNASFEAVLAFKNYYRLLFQELNDCIKGVIGEEFYKDEHNGKLLNLVEIYGIDSLTFDINNIDFNSFVDVLTNNSKILNAISVITNAVTSVATTNSLVKYNANFLIRQTSSSADHILYENLFNKYALRSNNSPYIYDDEKGDYVENSNFIGNLEDINKHSMSQFDLARNSAIQAAEGLSRSIESIFNNIGENVDRFIKNKPQLYNAEYDAAFTLTKTSLLEYYKEYESNNKTTIEKIESISNFNDVNDTKILSSEYNKVKSKNEFKRLITIRNKTIVQYGEGTLKLEKIKTTADKIAGVINKVKTLASIAADAFKIINIWTSKEKNHNKVYETVDAVKSIIGSITKMLPPNPIALCVGAALNLLFEFALQFIGKRTTSDYVYTDTGNTSDSYVWDGGITNSKFWGLQTIEERSINDAKIMTPIEVVPEFTDTYYYFNGKRYLTPNDKQLKEDILNAIMSGKLKTNSLQLLYSFEKNTTKYNKKGNSYFYGSLSSLKEWLTKDNLKNLKEKYSTNGGYIEFENLNTSFWASSYSEIQRKLLEIIDEKLKATIVMKLPKLIDGIPIDQYNKNHKFDNNSIDYENLQQRLNSFKKEKNNDSLEDLLIFDTNLFNKIGSKYYYEESKDFFDNNLKIFGEKFTVKSKLCSKRMFLTTKEYDKLEASASYKIYKINGLKGEYKMFLTYDDAINYLHRKNYLDIEQKNEKYNFVHKYYYDHQYFNSWDEIIKYCKMQSDKIRKELENQQGESHE